MTGECGVLPRDPAPLAASAASVPLLDAGRAYGRCSLAEDGPVSDLMRMAVSAGHRVGRRPPLRRALKDVLAVLPETPEAHGSLTRGVPAAAAAIRVALGNADGLAARYCDDLARAEARVDAIAAARLRAAHRRIAAGIPPVPGEYSWRDGLAGIGAGMLRREHPERDETLRAVLRYLVALTRPLTRNGETRPGWWPARQDDPSHDRADLGVADGTAGVLALLALAHRRGVRVDRHRAAIRTLADWYRLHQQGADEDTPWWPEVVFGPEPATGRSVRPDSGWAGTLGIARSLQLAGIVLGDPGLRRDAVAAAEYALTEPMFRSGGLCGGPHGAALTALRMVRDEDGGEHRPLAAAAASLPRAADPSTLHGVPAGGFLDGEDGVLASCPPNGRRPALPGPDAEPWDWVLLTAC
ncbi:lanthionine synthetase LanC family protein [Amycolatopsis sp. NPDC004079]|uniref:lanthionine synthetase LanC family protein n=1 Tax=Amycolatopsis sp. NPDC004079 TaxID=3154549 RepID=UPI0033AFA4A4